MGINMALVAIGLEYVLLGNTLLDCHLELGEKAQPTVMTLYAASHDHGLVVYLTLLLVKCKYFYNVAISVTSSNKSSPAQSYPVLSSNAPDQSIPAGNGWQVIAGAKSASSCFRSFAVCLK